MSTRALLSEPRPMYWSVRRELWENRFLYLAPMVVAAISLFGAFVSVVYMPMKMRALPAGDAVRLHALVTRPFDMAPAPIMLATLMVGVFYSLDALYGERRDRSILFWKSLPVSDRTAVLSKASIPLIVLPLIAFTLSVIVQRVLLLLGTFIFLGNGLKPATLWSEFQFVEGSLMMLYGLGVHALWYAPIYGWLLLVSAWAKRVPLLWAVMPLMIVSAVEMLAFNTKSFMRMLQYRVTGAMTEAFAFRPVKGSSHPEIDGIQPGNFLTRPGLWVGLAFAALCIAAAVRLRRDREPI
jgi:ABC-2 type transport system permease protein